MSAAAAASRHRWLAVAAGRAAMPDVAKQDFYKMVAMPVCGRRRPSAFFKRRCSFLLLINPACYIHCSCDGHETHALLLGRDGSHSGGYLGHPPNASGGARGGPLKVAAYTVGSSPDARETGTGASSQPARRHCLLPPAAATSPLRHSHLCC